MLFTAVNFIMCFPPQVKGGRRSEALGPGAETLPSVSIRDWTDHRLCSLCVQRKGRLHMKLHSVE